VPWTNKQLDITFATFRDKTLPGSEEKWKVKISGYKGQKAAAEMLASMYDASLDQFKPHSWSVLNIWPNYYSNIRWNGNQNFIPAQSFQKWWIEEYIQPKEKRYDELMSVGYRNRIMIRGKNTMAEREVAADMSMEQSASATLNEVVVTGVAEKRQARDIGYASAQIVPPPVIVSNPDNNTIDQSKIQIRKNFNETAFFFPELRTDNDGNIEFSFTMPEALTQWKLMTLAHTKELASGYATKTVITQKELMVQPFAPRFLREGDKMEFSAKIVNLGNKVITGQAQLQLFNATTMAPINGWFKNAIPVQSFSIPAGQSTAIKFNIDIPTNYNNAVVYRIVAKAGDVSDGEEMAIPVLTNRMLVTETMPLPMRGNTTKNSLIIQ
jgi:hypothetical protein